MGAITASGTESYGIFVFKFHKNFFPCPARHLSALRLKDFTQFQLVYPTQNMQILFRLSLNTERRLAESGGG